MKKQNRNIGRDFYCCAKERAGVRLQGLLVLTFEFNVLHQCKFFQWADEGKPWDEMSFESRVCLCSFSVFVLFD